MGVDRRIGTGGGVLAGSVAAIMFLSASPALRGDELGIRETVRRDHVSGAAADLVYPVGVIAGSGWRRTEIDTAIRRARAIFNQCRVVVDAGAIYWLNTPVEYLTLKESWQGRLLSKLPLWQPVVVFVGRTAAGDTAYSYLGSAPVASAGSAWIARHADPACRGQLLAHEIGHILLETGGHSAEPGNLMSHTCIRSNLSRARPNTILNEDQCRRIRLHVARIRGQHAGSSPAAGH